MPWTMASILQLPLGRLFFQIRGAFAEYEAAMIRERTRAGLASARRRGKRLGRPRAYVPVSKALSLLAEGKSVSATARELGVSRGTLQRVLKKVSAGTAARPQIHASL